MKSIFTITCFDTLFQAYTNKKQLFRFHSLSASNLLFPQLEEAWLDDEHSEFLEQLKMEMLEEQQREEMELAALQEEQEHEQVRQLNNKSFVIWI